MEIIGLLRAERRALVERLDQVNKMLCQYEELDRIAQALLSPSGSSTRMIDSHKPEANTAVPTSSASPTVPGLVRRKKTPTDEFERAVIDVLRVANAPLDRVKLYEALTARGVVIGDGDRDKELNALSARVYRMAKDGRLKSRRGQGYQLRNPESVDGSRVAATEGDASSNNGNLDDLLGR